MEFLVTTLSTILWMAVALGILVFVHELGHFLAARMFGMRVDAFSLGFPPNLVSKQVGDTEYRIGAIPLGGYVKIAGMVDESMDVPYELEPAFDDAGNPILDDDGQPMWTEKLDARGRPIPADTTPQPDEYRSKPVWQRAVVISAGVVFNVIFAILIYGAMAWAYGQPYTPAENMVFDVVPGSPAAEMGMRTGDRIVGVNGELIERYEDVFTPETISGDFSLIVLRGGDRVELASEDGLVTELSRRAREVQESGEAPSPTSVFGITPRYPTVLGGVASGSAADDAGLQPGDRIVSIDGNATDSWLDMTDQIQATGGRAVPVRWARPDSLGPAPEGTEVVEKRGAATVYQAQVAPRASGERYQLGVIPDASAVGQRIDRVGPGDALAIGTDETLGQVTGTFAFLGKMVTGRESVRENVGGPLMIAQQSKAAADRGWIAFWAFVAQISIALAVFNILPIPALDGGHLVFLAYEGIVRREPSLKVRMVVQQVGVALILALMVFVIFNDALRMF